MARYPTEYRTTARAVAVLAGVMFVALKSLPAYHETLRPEYDELAYLQLANDVAEAGGWSTFLPRCVSGEYREANRHPLYLLMLATIAERDPAFYPRAKLASWLIGLAATGILLLVVLRIAGSTGVVLVALLLGHNDLWLGMSYSVAVEMLLFSLLAPAWYWICFHPASIRAQVAAGACLGFAYLTKATTLIVVLAYLLAQIWTNRVQVARNRAAWALLAAALFVASPIVIRNVRLFGSPFFNVNSKYMWLDDWSDVKLADEDTIATQSLVRFVERNGAGTLLVRVFGGIVREASYLLTALSLFHDRVSIEAVAVGLVPLVIGLAGTRRLPNRAARVFTSLLVVGFLSALSLHTPHASHPRFQLTLLPLLYATLALEMASWLAVLGRSRSSQAAPPAQESDEYSLIASGIGAVAALISMAVGQTWAQTWPPRLLDARPPSENELIMADWMAARLSPDDAVVLGGTDFSPYWYRKISGRVFEYPTNPDARTFVIWSARRTVTGVVLDTRRVPRWAADWSESSNDRSSGATVHRWVLEFESPPLRFYLRAVTPASRGLPPDRTP
jgi:hypothetical protein